ncbi:FtsX-like permease family protein [Chitinophaga sp. SYP-B3965]|uniref:ABC transporter permease n=1 Tax=Chitinophaga sp. SYP-B3965 TaxID=2663120 RepID=UPI001299AA2A|nr:ABC transporter permease [Chitinophaga sp. SYP-B3965]MRG46291.1 FtsX-like permease family protein [Chitinophaga sp. SYP-B3965]
MLRNYIKIAWRNLWNNKVFGIINIAGLTFGLTCCMFILLWVANESSYNRYHEKLPNIYQVYQHQYYSNNEILTVTATPGPLADQLKAEIPDIQKAAALSWVSEKLLAVGEHGYKSKGQYANVDVFSVFTFPFVDGDPTKALRGPNDIVLTEKLARNLFGDSKAVGKSVRLDNKEDYMVVGVMKDLPENSSLKFEWLLPMERCVQENPFLKNWGGNAPRTYVLVDPKSNIDKVNAKVKGIIQRNQKESQAVVFLYPYKDVYLEGRFDKGVLDGGRIEYVRLFIIIAIFVLLIACINFMNLSTARAIQRSKEVGVRKSIGAGKGALISQFLGESFALVFIATALSLLLVWTLLPSFEKLVNITLSVPLFTWYNMLALLALALFTGFIAGSYPAFYLSSLNAVTTLKGGILRLRSSAIWLRKGLVVFQFVVSTVLIVAAFLIYQQINFIKNRNLGLNKDQVVWFFNEGSMVDDLRSFRTALLNMPGVEAVSDADQLPIQVGSNFSGVGWKGKSPNEDILFDNLLAGYDFQKTMQLEMVEGRTFSPEFATDTNGIVINETAAKVMSLKPPYVGQALTVDDTQLPIIGVTKDFSSNHLQKKVAPMVIRYRSKSNKFILVRIKPEQMETALSSIDKVYKQFNPQYPFEIKYLDASFADMYKSEQVIGRLSAAFTALAIFIACLGLFGLATFTAQQRTKEIGIRKVLGASIMQILTLLSKEFLRLVLIAVGIALPLAAYFMDGWLNKFAYHVNISWWVYVVTGLLAIVLAMLTVSYQSIRTARMNPVKSLRSE